jgi:hypothetical protein
MKIIFTLTLLFCTSLVSYSQDDSNAKDKSTSGWELDVAPYIWAAGLSADVSFLDQTLPVKVEFKDLLNNLRMGFLLHTEISKGKWFIMGDLVYLKVGKDGRIVALSLDTKIEIKQTVAELGVGYNLLNSQDWLFIDGFTGFRYFSIVNNIGVGAQNLLDKTINTTDPLVGIRFRTVTKKWVNSARVDVGGFGIGSEISWKANILIGYKFSNLFSLYMGFQGYGIDYEKDDFGLDLTSAGFLTGFNFHF